MGTIESFINWIIEFNIRILIVVFPIFLIFAIVNQILVRNSETFKYATNFTIQNDSLQNEIGKMNHDYGWLISTETKYFHDSTDYTYYFKANGDNRSVYITCTVRVIKDRDKLSIIGFSSQY